MIAWTCGGPLLHPSAKAAGQVPVAPPSPLGEGPGVRVVR